MDGHLFTTIVSCTVTVAGSIGIGAWRLGKAMGQLQGRVNGFKQRFDSIDNTVAALDARIDSLVNRRNKE